MTPQAATPDIAPARAWAAGEWLLVLGLAVTVAWTTLCLGGYLAETMVVTSAAPCSALTALGGGLWLAARGGEPLTFNWAALLPVPFLVYALASVLWLAPAQWLAWREWLLWLQMWLVFVLVLHFGRGWRQTWVLVGTFIALGVAGTAIGGLSTLCGSPLADAGLGAWLEAGGAIPAGRLRRDVRQLPNSLAALVGAA